MNDLTAGRHMVDIIVINWNGLAYLPTCIAALRSLSTDVRITIVDNASTDGSLAYLRSEHTDLNVISLSLNRGYAAGANVGLQATSADYVMIMNPDVHFAPDHIDILKQRLDADERIGAAQGKLYQIGTDDFLAGRFGRAANIDSAGHAISRTRMVFDRGQGKPDSDEYGVEASVFSACGAALFLRRAMLADVAADGEYFAEAFFAYKEDVDLGWRARLRGWDIRYIPAAVGYHVRTAPLDLKTWRHMPLAVRRHSWKNHYLLIIRNDRAGHLLRALPFVVGWEILRFGYALVCDPRVLGGYAAIARELRGALRARRAISASRRAAPEEIRRWFGAGAMAVSGSPVSTGRYV